MYNSLVITQELKIQLELIANDAPDYVSDLILALSGAINGEKLDPEEMSYPVRTCFQYWMNGNIARIIKEE